MYNGQPGSSGKAVCLQHSFGGSLTKRGWKKGSCLAPIQDENKVRSFCQERTTFLLGLRASEVMAMRAGVGDPNTKSIA